MGIYGTLFGGAPDDAPAAKYGLDPNYQTAQLGYLGEQKQKAYGQADVAAAGQGQVAQQYADAAMGKGPSVAELQMQAGAHQAMQNAANVAANASGHNALLANQQALQANQQLGMDTNQQAAMLRAQETAQARQGQASVLGQMRDQAQQQGQFHETTAQNMNQAVLGGDNNIAQANLKKESDYQHDRSTGIGGLIAGVGAGAIAACCAPHTLIATPHGERRIDEMKVGDLVFSEVNEKRVVAMVAQVRRQEWAPGSHTVLRMLLNNGRHLEVSSTHPDETGAPISELRCGDMLGEVELLTTPKTIPFEHSHTYDIRPDTEDGLYYAEGALIGSTIPKEP